MAKRYGNNSAPETASARIIGWVSALLVLVVWLTFLRVAGALGIL